MSILRAAVACIFVLSAQMSASQKPKTISNVNLEAMYAQDRQTPPTPENPPAFSNEEMHRITAEAFYKSGREWTQEDHEALIQIVWKESRFKPGETNPKSTSSGLSGFLNSTRRKYGIPKHADAWTELGAMIQYCDDRYGSPEAALRFHRKHNWY